MEGGISSIHNFRRSNFFRNLTQYQRPIDFFQELYDLQKSLSWYEDFGRQITNACLGHSFFNYALICIWDLLQNCGLFLSWRNMKSKRHVGFSMWGLVYHLNKVLPHCQWIIKKPDLDKIHVPYHGTWILWNINKTLSFLLWFLEQVWLPNSCFSEIVYYLNFGSNLIINRI